MRYFQHLSTTIGSRKHMQCRRLADENMSLVHIDIPYIFRADIDGLHESTRAHIMQVCMTQARTEERRVCESVHAGDGGEG